MSGADPTRPPSRVPRRQSLEQPVWQQALLGIGLVAAGAIVVVVLGVVLAAVVAWLF